MLVVARSVIALVVGSLLLIVMLCALASEATRDIAARRRITTLSRRNPSIPAQS
jgi:hypothetical protein